MPVLSTIAATELKASEIGVIMPAYNAEKYISTAVRSILDQTHRDLILVVVDDTSSDNTWNVLQQIDDSRLYIHRLENNMGPLNIRNLVLPALPCEYITYQDADDWSAPDRFEKQLRFLKQHPDLAMCGTGINAVFGNYKKQIRYPETHGELHERLTSGATKIFCGATLMFHKKVLDQVGLQDELFAETGAGDVDWYLRAFEKVKCGNLPEPFYNYRQDTSSYSKKAALSSGLQAADLAFFTYLLRQAQQPYSIESLAYLFTAEQTRSSDSGIFETLLKKLKYYLYMIIPEALAQSLVRKNRLSKCQKLLSDYQGNAAK